jgi:hypothetical protein
VNFFPQYDVIVNLSDVVDLWIVAINTRQHPVRPDAPATPSARFYMMYVCRGCSAQITLAVLIFDDLFPDFRRKFPAVLFTLFDSLLFCL